MKKIKAILLFSVICGMAAFGSAYYLITSEPKQVVPETLASKIAKNIRQHPNDWKLKEDTSVTAYDYWSGHGGRDTLVNDKCGIKILYSSFNSKILLPDTLELTMAEHDTIYTAYYETIELPVINKERAEFKKKEDIKAKKRADKEKSLLNKICSN